ncbi:MAG: metallophosphoesterase [Acidobacteria bacterium]|nr:metallophosphoesterase [Acidobacteriota bacterium]
MKFRNAAFVSFLIVIFAIPGLCQDQPFYFVMIADPQLGMYAADKNFIRETANFEFVIATINRLKPEFVIILGDLVNKPGDPEQLAEFKRIAGKIDSSIPTYYLAGNHDVDHTPTPETLAAYRRNVGRDYYSFRAGPIYGIVLNSTVIHSPKNVEAEYQEQLSWFKAELEKSKGSGAPHVVVFQHHPYFIENAQEPEQFGNIPPERRKPFLDLLHQYNVKYVFAGHVHKSSVGRDGDLVMTVTGPVSMPFGEEGSGIRLVEVTREGIRHRFFSFSRMPDGLTIK